jgi:hypothetical protein
MADVRSTNSHLDVPQMAYDENGRLVTSGNAYDVIPSSVGQFAITYGSGELDPTQYINDSLNGIAGDLGSPMKRFLHHLSQEATLKSVYEFLFLRTPRRAGLQFLIITNERIVQEYGHVICSYLATNFGCDIVFIDPVYRPNIKGLPEYKLADKSFAEAQLIRIKNERLINEFQATMSHTGGQDECISNLTGFLNNFNVHELIYLYELLFPFDKLPPNNYSADHMRQIIIGNSTAHLPSFKMNNIYSTQAFYDELAKWEAQIKADEGEPIDIQDYLV